MHKLLSVRQFADALAKRDGLPISRQVISHHTTGLYAPVIPSFKIGRMTVIEAKTLDKFYLRRQGKLVQIRLVQGMEKKRKK